MSTPTNIPETPMGETVPDSFFESKEKFHLQLQDIFQTIMRLTGPDQFDQLCQWMEYQRYLTIHDFYDSSYKDPEKFDTKGPATEYKWKGKMNHLSPVVTTVRRRPIVPLGQRCSVNLLPTKKLGGRDANTNQIR